MTVTNVSAMPIGLPKIYQDLQAHIEDNKSKYGAAITTSNILDEIDNEIYSTPSPSKQLELMEEWETYYSEFETQCQEYYNHSAKQFNFMEGQDPNNKEAYNAQLLKLGQGDLITIDADGNGEVSQEEYVRYELSSLGEADTETMKQTIGTAAFVFDVMDILFDEEQTHTLDADDFAKLYKQFDNQTNGLNGEFSIDDQGLFLEYIINAVEGSTSSIEMYGESYYKKFQLEDQLQ